VTARRRKGRPTEVGALVGRILDDLGLETASAAHRIGERWAEVVGEEVARHCRPVSLRGGVLETVVDSSVWCQQLQLQSPRLLAALRDAWGDEAPRELRFSLGYTAPRSHPRSP